MTSEAHIQQLLDYHHTLKAELYKPAQGILRFRIYQRAWAIPDNRPGHHLGWYCHLKMGDHQPLLNSYATFGPHAA